MNDFDAYDDNAIRAEAQELARRDRAEHLVRLLQNRRPPVFARDGELHPDITAWTEHLLRGGTSSLVLIGAVGTGKTWSIWKAIETMVRRGWSGTYEIANAYEVREATDLPVDRDALHRWGDAGLFAVDDIGSQRINDWDADALFALIDKRWQYQRPVIISSNVPDLRGLVGDRSASRLVDDATVVMFTGDDRRRSR